MGLPTFIVFFPWFCYVFPMVALPFPRFSEMEKRVKLATNVANRSRHRLGLQPVALGRVLRVATAFCWQKTCE